MLTLEFNEKEQKIIDTFIKLEIKLEDPNSTWTTHNERAHNLLTNTIARMISLKARNLPWK